MLRPSEAPGIRGGAAGASGPPADGSDCWYDHDELRERLRRSVRRVCPRWLTDSAEDIVQVALLRVADVRRRGETSHPLPSSYVWKVAYSATVDEIRRRQRERAVPLDESPGAHDAASPEGGPERDEALRRLRRGITECLARLITPRRITVGLHLLGHEPAEIAVIAGWDGKRTRNLLHRGLTDLRRCLADKGLAP
jgi:RNA polymerase sigma-70 factor (ECF subfamily)